MTTTKTFATTFEELRTALEARQVVSAGVPDFEAQKPGWIGTHSYVPDPRFAGLLALVRERCEHPKGAWKDFEHHRARCRTCYAEWDYTPGNRVPLGYITRTAYWEVAPEGALWGSVIFALWHMSFAASDQLRRRLRLWGGGSPKEDVAEALLVWVKETP